MNSSLSDKIPLIKSRIDQCYSLINKTPQSPIIQKNTRDLYKAIINDYKSLNLLLKSLETQNKGIITIKELERRRNQLNELKNLIKDLEIHLQKEPLYEKPIEKGENSPSDYKKPNKQLLEEQNRGLEAQETEIEGLLGSVGAIKAIGININRHLDEEKGLLGDLGKIVEKNTRKIIDNNKKLDIIMEKVSNQCLICFIIIEIVIIIVLFMIF